PALDSKAESAVSGAPTAPVGDLGDVPDAATLRARALAVGATSSAGASASAARSSSGAASDSQASPTNTGNTSAALSPAPASGGTAAVVAPNVVGTRPCEERARAREPNLGPVTYFATARRGNVPAYVLGFGTGPTVTLLMLAQDGCAELLRSAGP
ncbi:MAG: hypothetical protein Q8K72_07130, partial [Acidimicrobiales bacterium]|nr:hypothetical protein [Acidimicrobiales bacterium]